MVTIHHHNNINTPGAIENTNATRIRSTTTLVTFVSNHDCLGRSIHTISNQRTILTTTVLLDILLPFDLKRYLFYSKLWHNSLISISKWSSIKQRLMTIPLTHCHLWPLNQYGTLGLFTLNCLHHWIQTNNPNFFIIIVFFISTTNPTYCIIITKQPWIFFSKILIFSMWSNIIPFFPYKVLPILQSIQSKLNRQYHTQIGFDSLYDLL